MRQSLQLCKPVGMKALGAIILAGLIGLGGCASPDLAVREAEARQPLREHESRPSTTSDVGQFEAIECLLPPRIRRVGTQLIYLEPRHQVTTASRECALRGGDAIALDAPKTAT